MELALLAGLLGLLPVELIPDVPPTPDDDEVYEQFEEAVAGRARQPGPLWLSDARLLVRVRTDSPAGGFSRCATFTRAVFERPGWKGCLLLEKDRGESSPADFFGGGISYAGPRWRFMVGDYSTDFGEGLLLVGPQSRSLLPRGAWQDRGQRLSQAALENRNLRGVGLEYGTEPLRLALATSYALRDARLNPDRTVARLVTSGVHDDSAARAEQRQVGQWLGAFHAGYTGWTRLVIGASAQGVRYTRRLAPADSAVSFCGRDLAAASAYVHFRGERGTAGLELAHSLPGGGAATLRVAVNGGGFRASAHASALQDRFFAPAGRYPGLTGRRGRFDGGVRLNYDAGPLRLGISGNTRRDYAVDSMPGRLEATAAYESGRAQVRLALGRRYRLAAERSRTGRLECGVGLGPAEFTAVLADEYPDYTDSRGRMAVLAAEVEVGPAEFTVTGAWLDITGPGVRMSVPEAGPMRIGSYYGSSESALRFSAAASVSVPRLGRLGVKLGLARVREWMPDLGAQLEVGIRR